MQRPGLWERLDTPIKVIGGIVAAIVAVISIYLAIAGNPFAPSAAEREAETNPAVVAARQIRRCLATHGMRSPRVTLGQPHHHLRFRRCDWPPLTDTSTDGYSEINDFVTAIPGKYAAELYDTVDRFALPCDSAKVTYVLAQMGGREFVSRRVSAGRLYLVTGVASSQSPFRVVIKQLSETPLDVERYIAPPSNARKVFVLHSAHFEPFDAVCIRNK